MISMVRLFSIICSQDNQDKSYIIACPNRSMMGKFEHESGINRISEHERLIKATLEQWIDDLKKEVTQLQSRKHTQKLQVTFNP